MGKRKKPSGAQKELMDSLMEDLQKQVGEESQSSPAPTRGKNDDFFNDPTEQPTAILSSVKPPPPPKDLYGTSDSDQTINLEKGRSTTQVTERTVPVHSAPAKRKNLNIEEKVSVGQFRSGSGPAQVFTSGDASLAQSATLRSAQNRITELEKEVDSLRAENDELSGAAEIIQARIENLTAKMERFEREKQDLVESYESEKAMLKGKLQFKESELNKAKRKIEELETRLKADFKKVRVRERELENRLDLARAEKVALIRTKDEQLLELKRRLDSIQLEVDNYRTKIKELNRSLDSNQEQFKRTIKALRVALANLEANDEYTAPLKKAE